MQIVYLDFEMNKTRSHKASQIISFGATTKENNDTFYSLVTLTEDEEIPWRIFDLTGISERDIELAPSFMKVLRSFLDWSKDVDKFFIWGSYDISCLYYSYKLFKNKFSATRPELITVSSKEFHIFLRKVVDIQPFILRRLGESENLNLEFVLEKYGVLNKKDFIAHNALNDASALKMLDKYSYKVASTKNKNLLKRSR